MTLSCVQVEFTNVIMGGAPGFYFILFCYILSLVIPYNFHERIYVYENVPLFHDTTRPVCPLYVPAEALVRSVIA